MKIDAAIESWPLRNPLRITGYVFESIEVLRVSIEMNGRVGFGEAAGVYYMGDTPQKMLAKVGAIRHELGRGISRSVLKRVLPNCGLRNALDCALWDLEAKCTGRSVWNAAGLSSPKPLVTTFTCGVDTPQAMADAALGYTGAKAIKLKLNGDHSDADRVRVVREACPHVWLGVDANQAYDVSKFQRLVPTLMSARVALVEQPFPIGCDTWLDELVLDIPLAADESFQGIGDVDRVAARYQVLNIKLDKCGGLTEALEIVEAARSHSLKCMIGNMLGTSLAMLPAFVVGQLCSIADLDGPALLKADREPSVRYIDGEIHGPIEAWGGV
jgi:L-alanine-DL-glutamate epimerase-like enolase superfamily enzyme